MDTNFEGNLKGCEYSLYNGERFVTFNIVEVNTDKNEITVAVSDEGKISVCTYELRRDKDGRLFFEYGVLCQRIAVKDFEYIEEN